MGSGAVRRGVRGPHARGGMFVPRAAVLAAALLCTLRLGAGAPTAPARPAGTARAPARAGLTRAGSPPTGRRRRCARNRAGRCHRLRHPADAGGSPSGPGRAAASSRRRASQPDGHPAAQRRRARRRRGRRPAARCRAGGCRGRHAARRCSAGRPCRHTAAPARRNRPCRVRASPGPGGRRPCAGPGGAQPHAWRRAEAHRESCPAPDAKRAPRPSVQAAPPPPSPPSPPPPPPPQLPRTALDAVLQLNGASLWCGHMHMRTQFLRSSSARRRPARARAEQAVRQRRDRHPGGHAG